MTIDSTEFHGELTTEDVAALNEIMDRWERAFEQGVRATARDACANRPDLIPLVERQIAALESMAPYFSTQSDMQQTQLEHIGPYRVIRRLASGAYSAVFVCEQAEPRRNVAVKMLKAEIASVEQRGRFLRELYLLGRLNHPGIARIFEGGVANVGAGLQPYFAMEWVAGPHLDEFLRSSDGNESQTLALFLKICDAVEHAHQNGIIHRDLKPSNIVVEANGQPRLLDFGIARLAEQDSESELWSTHTASFLGTPPYMSPEQFGDHALAVDTRSDIYSLGVLLFEMLTGCLPYDIVDKPLIEIAEIIRFRPPHMLRSFAPAPRDLEVIVSTLLEKAPECRYQSVTALTGDIRRFLRGEPVSARPLGQFEQLARWCRRNRLVTGLSLVTIGLLCLGLMTSSFFATASRRLASKLTQSVDQLTVARNHADRQTEIAESRKDQLVIANDGLVRQVGLLRRSLYNASLIRAQHHAMTDPGLALEWLADVEQFPLEFRGFAWQLLERQCQRTVSVLEPLRGPIETMAISTDGNFVATAGNDDDVCLWDRATGRLIASIDAGVGPGAFLAFGADSEFLVVGNRNGRIASVGIRNGHLMNLAIARDAEAACVAISEDGRHIATGGRNGAITIWDRQLTEVAEFDTDGRRVVCVAFDRSHLDQVHAILRDGSHIVWNVRSGELLESTSFRFGPVHRAAVSDHRRFVAMAKQFDEIVICDMRTKTVLRTIRVRSLRNDALVFAHADALRLVTAHRLRLQTWNPLTGQRVSAIRGHTDRISDLVVSADGRWVASSSHDGTVRVQTVHPPPCHLELVGPRSAVNAIAFSPDSEQLAAGDPHGKIRVTDVRSGSERAVLQGHVEPVTAVAYSPPGDFLASADNAGSVRIWHAATGKLDETLPATGMAVRSLAFSADGRELVVPSGSAGILIWSLDRRMPIHRLPSQGTPTLSVACSPDGNLLASGDRSGKIRVWKYGSFDLLAQHNAHGGRVTGIVFAHDGKSFVTASTDGTLRQWKIPDLLLIRTMMGHRDAVSAVAMSPDSDLLISGGRDGQIILWDTVTGQRQMTLDGHPAGLWIHALAFRPDGRMIGSAADEAVVRLWPGSAD